MKTINIMLLVITIVILQSHSQNTQGYDTFKKDFITLKERYKRGAKEATTDEEFTSIINKIGYESSLLEKEVRDYINRYDKWYDSKFKKLLYEVDEFRSFTRNQICDCSEYFFSIINDIAENHIIISDLEEFQIRSFTVGNFKHHYVIPKSIDYLYTVTVKASNNRNSTYYTFGLVGEIETFNIRKISSEDWKTFKLTVKSKQLLDPPRTYKYKPCPNEFPRII